MWDRNRRAPAKFASMSGTLLVTRSWTCTTPRCSDCLQTMRSKDPTSSPLDLEHLGPDFQGVIVHPKRFQHLEIAALVGLRVFSLIETVIAVTFLGRDDGWRPRGPAAFKLGAIEQKLYLLVADQNAGSDRRFATAPARHPRPLREKHGDDRVEGSARHPHVRNAQHVLDARCT